MNKYIDGVILATSLCSVGLATLSFAEDKIPQKQSETLKDIQLQRLDKSLALNLKQIENEVIQTTPKTIIETTTSKSIPTIALNLIKEFEGFESQAYVDTDGTPVIGYGLSKIAGKSVQLGDRISTKQAEQALNSQMAIIQEELKKAIKVNLSDHQLSAVASLAFNVGVDSLKESTLIRKINAQDYAGAANEFLRWDKANVRGNLVQLPGLSRRRQAERKLFLER